MLTELCPVTLGDSCINVHVNSTKEKITCGKTSPDSTCSCAILTTWRSPTHSKLDDSQNHSSCKLGAGSYETTYCNEYDALNKKHTDHSSVRGFIAYNAARRRYA